MLDIKIKRWETDQISVTYQVSRQDFIITFIDILVLIMQH